MQPTVSIDMRTIQDLDRSLTALALLSGRSMDSVIRQASQRAVRSAAKATPAAKKNRPSSRAKTMFADAKTRRKKGVPWWAVGMVEIWSKGQPRTAFFRTNASFQRARAVPRRYLAKNVWIARANAFKRQQVHNTRLANAYGKTDIRKTGGNISSVAMSNQLSYISKIAPSSARIAIHKTDKWIEGFALKKVERQMLRQFGRGTAAIRGF